MLERYGDEIGNNVRPCCAKFPQWDFETSKGKFTKLCWDNNRLTNNAGYINNYSAAFCDGFAHSLVASISTTAFLLFLAF